MHVHGRFPRWFRVLALVSLLVPAGLTGGEASVITWEDREPGTLVTGDKPSGLHFPDPVIAEESVEGFTCSGTRHLAKVTAGTANGETTDPGPLVMRFDRPQPFLALCVGNPDGKQAREITLAGYSSQDALKPAVIDRITLPAGTPVAHVLTLCRLLEHDLVRVELTYGDDGVERFDDLRLSTDESVTTRITFEEHPAGTLLQTQYPGVTFPGRPEIVTSAALGLPVRSEGQALRQRIAGELDGAPLTFDLLPAQGGVRLWTGYPPAEQHSGPLTIRMVAYSGRAKTRTAVAESRLELPSPDAVRHKLELCRPECDITRVEVWFEASFGGHEVIDDLEFGPHAPRSTPDLAAPEIVIESPANRTVLAQPSSRPEHRSTTVTLRGRLREDRALNRFEVSVHDTNGVLRFNQGDQLGLVRGTAPDFTFEVPVGLDYGTHLLRLTATDADGHTTVVQHEISYLGPPPVEVTGSTPSSGYPGIVFRQASDSGPGISNDPPVVRLTGRHLHAETRFFLIPESQASLTPSAPDLIEVVPSYRSPAGDLVDLPVPPQVFQAPGTYVWLVWDLWSRPEGVPWTRGGTFAARAWPIPALWSLGFRNRDETNGIGDFEAVFGDEVLSGFLEPEIPVLGCDRGVTAVVFYGLRYLPSLNGPGMNGSCFGFAAMSQLFATGQREPSAFEPAVRLPTGFRAPTPMEFLAAGCAPQVAGNLWATIQTLFGVHTSYEFLEEWNDQADAGEGNGIIGNPVATADLIRDYPAGYVLGFTPFGTSTGHAVAPYRVENLSPDLTRIWVIDSNFPYDPTQPEEATVNQVALHRFIDVRRAARTFSFSLGATTNVAAEYQAPNPWVGSALVAIPLTVFTQPRTIPLGDFLVEVSLGVSGDHELTLESNGKTWGWDEAGRVAGVFPGLKAVPSFGGEDPASANPLVLFPPTTDPVEVSLAGKDSTHDFTVIRGGVWFSSHRPDRDPAQKDRYVLLTAADGAPQFRFTPGSPAPGWEPTLAFHRVNEGDLSAKLHGLTVEAGDSLDLTAVPETRGFRVQHARGEALRFHLELSASTPKAPSDRRWFGPFELPSGAWLDIVPSRWPALDAIDVLLDEDHDGVPETTTVAAGLPIDLKPGDAGDCNRNGLLDGFDLAVGTSVDLNADGTPDDCSGTGGGGDDGGHGNPCADAPPATVDFSLFPAGAVNPDALGSLQVPAGVVEDGTLRNTPPLTPGADPATLSLQWKCPRSAVTLGVVNTAKAPVRARAYAYASSDATKPVAEATAVLPADGSTVPLALCRPLDADISLVVLEYEGGGREALRTVTHGTDADRRVHHLDFEDRPAGTVLYAQYPGVTFVDRPVISTTDSLGVTTSTGTQLVRKSPLADNDPAPLTLRFNPPQAAVRLRVGYPLSERDGRPLRVVLRAYGAGKGSTSPLAMAETTFTSVQNVGRLLGVTRCSPEIHEVQLEFVDRPASGLEVFDDLEFGPVDTGGSGADTNAPIVRVLSPADGTLIPQLNPANPTGGTNIVVEITENQTLETVEVVVRDGAGAEVGRPAGGSLRLTGSAPRYTLQAVIPLTYGRNLVEVRAVDGAGNAGSNLNPLVLHYQGPPPLRLDTVSTAIGYPEDLVKEENWVRPDDYPEVRLRTTEFEFRGTNFNAYTRVFAVPGSELRLPPAPTSLIPAEIVSRSPEGTALTVRLPGSVWAGLDASTDRSFRWVLEDAWTRPDRVQWVDGGPFTARQRPWPMTYGFGFVNEEGPNSLTDFDGVFGLSAYLSWTDFCWRDPVYLGFFEWGYSVTLNRAPGGSCFGYVAASQAIYQNDFNADWLNGGFYERTRLPAGRYGHGEIRENNPSCGPRSPSSLWSWIQTYHGVQQSEEHLYQQLNQIVQRSGEWRGNIAARLAQLRSRPPYSFLLCIKPRTGTTGHCVLPYRLEPLDERVTRIWVYDPNYPYRHFLPADHPLNIRSIHSYVDVDPVANSFTFDLDSNFDTNNVQAVRNHFHGGTPWSGEGLTITTLPVGRRTMPGLGYLADWIFSSVSGDARPEYTTAEGRRWGWNSDGKRVEEIDGAHPFTPYTQAGVETDQVLLVTPRTNAWTRARLRPTGARYQFVTGGGGLLLGFRNAGATPGSTDEVRQELVQGQPRALRFESVAPSTALEPFVVLPGTTGTNHHQVLWRWQELSLPAGAPVTFGAQPDTGVLTAHNDSGAPIVARLVREEGSESGTRIVDYGTVTLPPGTPVRLVPSGNPEAPSLTEESDANHDGAFERIATHVPRVAAGTRVLPVKFDHARKRLRLRIEGLPRPQVIIEHSQDLRHWNTVPVEPAADDDAAVETPVDAGSGFFRVRRRTGSTP